MSTREATVVNEDFQPSTNQEQVLGVLKEEHRANPKRIQEVTGLKRQRINEALGRLEAAGWVRQVTRGLYEFNEDPRDDVAGTIEIDADEAHELVEILDRSDVAGAAMWADRLREEGVSS